ncbi:MAG: hypothetical protein FWD94_02965, partial [Treponema sp.]|nr:hypothetical protein [Treponema sp.]
GNLSDFRIRDCPQRRGRSKKTEVPMKRNALKVTVLAAVVAAIGFSVTACQNNVEEYTGIVPQELLGTWVKDIDNSWIFSPDSLRETLFGDKYLFKVISAESGINNEADSALYPLSYTLKLFMLEASLGESGREVTTIYYLSSDRRTLYRKSLPEYIYTKQ